MSAKHLTEMNFAYIYLDDYADEVCPCAPTLEAWAAWLSKPAPNWNRPDPAKSGDQFQASALDMSDDIIATQDSAGKWSFSHTPPEGTDFFACRYTEGLGWDADSIHNTLGDMIDWLAENADVTEQQEHIACGRYVNKLIVTYRIEGGKPVCTLGKVQ